MTEGAQGTVGGLQGEGEEKKRKFESPHSLVYQLTWSSSVFDDAAAVVAGKWTPPWAAPHPWVSRVMDNLV